MDPIERPNNRDRIFKGQQGNEEFICFFRRHWIDILKEIMFLGIFILVVSLLIRQIDTIKNILTGNREMKLLFFTVFSFSTIYMHRFFLKILNYFVNTGIITDSRVIDHNKTLFFIDNLDSIDMSQIQNVEKIQEGVLPSILEYGDIKIFLTASDATKTLHRIPNAKFHFRCLNRAREARRRRPVVNEPVIQQFPQQFPIPVEEADFERNG